MTIYIMCPQTGLWATFGSMGVVFDTDPNLNRTCDDLAIARRVIKRLNKTRRNRIRRQTFDLLVV